MSTNAAPNALKYLGYLSPAGGTIRDVMERVSSCTQTTAQWTIEMKLGHRSAEPASLQRRRKPSGRQWRRHVSLKARAREATHDILEQLSESGLSASLIVGVNRADLIAQSSERAANDRDGASPLKCGERQEWAMSSGGA